MGGALFWGAVVWFGFRMVMGSGADYNVTLIDSPKDIPAGGFATFTWRIDGFPATINHASVYFGTVSNSGTLGKDIKPAETKYTDFVKDFADGKYDIPLQFVGNIKVDNPGKYYFRVHALIKDKHYWTDEYTFDVK